MNRLFVTFNKDTKFYKEQKVMPFTGMHRNQVWDIVVKRYGSAVDTILTEQELALQLPNYNENNFIVFGTPLETHYISVEGITAWFSKAKPNPTVQNIIQQMAYHLEEVAEMLDAVNNTEFADDIRNMKAYYLEQTPEQCENIWKDTDKVALLDSLADQVVTSIGVAALSKFNFDGALTEVNRSNWSKFNENGEPIIDVNGKILKGKNFSKPELNKFV